MKLVIAFTRPEIAVPIIREGNCYNFFFYSVLSKKIRDGSLSLAPAMLLLMLRR